MIDIHPKTIDETLERIMHAAENTAKHLERLELLKEHGRGVRVEYDQGDRYIVEKETPPHA